MAVGVTPATPAIIATSPSPQASLSSLWVGVTVGSPAPLIRGMGVAMTVHVSMPGEGAACWVMIIAREQRVVGSDHAHCLSGSWAGPNAAGGHAPFKSGGILWVRLKHLL